MGHVTPMLAVAAGLTGRGHDVRFLTGRQFGQRVASTGAAFVPLPPEADFDAGNLDAAFPGRAGLKGAKGIRFDIKEIFMRPGMAQYEAIQALLAERAADVVLAESLFMGAALLLTEPPVRRPAVINCGIVPLSLASRDTAPFGLGISPMPGPAGRLRNRVLRTLTEKLVFGSVQSYADDVARRISGAPYPAFFMDWPRLADHIAQFTVPSFEYPRSDLPATVHFVGPVSRGGRGGRGAPGGAAGTDLPGWWAELDGGRPVVHVTQGTVSNRNFGDLVRPAIEGLADDDVLVVVTNGGYGGVQFALQYGVPLVSAGETEDKAEVSARVAWSGCGINLRTNHAKPEAVAKAVRTVLSSPSYREASGRIGSEIRASRGVDELADLVESVSGGRRLPRGAA
ncbi:MAG: glycosyltransferase [Actinomycetales bacterium]